MAGCSIPNIRNYYARRWVASHLKVVPGKTQRWADKVTVKSVLSRMTLRDLAGYLPAQLQALTGLPSLRAHAGPWRPPVWPSANHVTSTLIRNWCEWTQEHRLHRRVQVAGRCRLRNFAARVSLPQVPDKWRLLDSGRNTAVRATSCRRFDDKGSAKMWSARPQEVLAHLVISRCCW